MTDVLTPAQRKLNMASIHGRNTRPELVVRTLVHGLGYRYCLHSRKLPGKPDIVLVRHRKIIFVNGCFWHMHKCRYGCVVPKTNALFWEKKRVGNVVRDKENIKLLRCKGWRVLVVWECWLKKKDMLEYKIRQFLKKK